MRPPWWVWAIAGTVLVAGLLAPYASSLPDGLESVIERHHISVTRTEQPSPLPDYQTPGVANHRLSVLVASAAGILLVFGATWAIGRVLSRRRPVEPPGAHQEPEP